MRQAAKLPGVFREKNSGLIRTVYHEIALRFTKGTPAKRRNRILGEYGFRIRRENRFVTDQMIVAHPEDRYAGSELLKIANAFTEMEEVVFATPNFVSEYRRESPTIPSEQWHLRNLGLDGQKAGEDVSISDAWESTKGKRSIVIAILDDGIDITHPALRRNIVKDRGRDFFLPDDHPDHSNPAPKRFQYPYDEMRGNDIHGTPCAGVAAASGLKAYGAAPRCKILPIKVFHADDLASDERVADAIRYAAQYADIISCSWSSGITPDIELALADAGEIGRVGRGTAIFCATGNEGVRRISFPASNPHTIAVGASNDQGKRATYSNYGPELDIVAPSSDDGRTGIFTTDVSIVGRGFNIGTGSAGGTDGLYTNDFGGTSSATPLAAGIGALVLSVNPALSREELRETLRSSADKIGHGYVKGRSPRYGYGRVNAAKAVERARKL
jgi:subtilisin family serine protease